MEIVYCADCGRKLREHDFVKGAAYTRDKHHFCTTCRPLDPQSPAAAAPKPKTTRALPAARSRRPAARGKLLPLLATGALLILGGVVVGVLSSRGGPPAAETPEDAEVAERSRREAAGRDALQRAKAFDAANVKDFDGKVSSWQKAVSLCEKTPSLREARQALERAVAGRDAERARLEAQKKALGPPATATWDFETLSGDAFVNGGGELYAAIRSPGVDQAEGLVGKAARFNGLTYLRIDGAEIFNAPDLSVSLWIKPVSVKGRQGLLSKRIDSKQSPIILTLWDGTIGFEAADESTQWPFHLRSLPLIKAGAWNHVAVVARSGRGVELYLNGAPAQDLKLDRHRCKNSDPMFLGREIFNGVDKHDGTSFYAGLLDELKIWIQPLSASEIKAQYEAVAPN